MITVKIQNYNAIKQYFAKRPQIIASELHRAVDNVATRISHETFKEAPVNKGLGGGEKGYGGNLRQSIYSRMTGAASAEVGVGVEYAIFVHEGTAPHMIQSRGNYPLRNKFTGQVFGRKVYHPGTRANPFLQRAVDKLDPWIQKEFENVLTNVLK